MKKIAIIGASYLQRSLVLKAKEIGFETHVFAWKEGNEIEDIADYYYPISILDKKNILEKCREINIDGITSIASDIAMPTVNYIAHELGLIGNKIEATLISTDKYEMRQSLANNGIACPKFQLFTQANFKNEKGFRFPVIVKPTDRSGSRGVLKVEKEEDVNSAIEIALKNSIQGRAIIEEFITGREFSVEMISYKGHHKFLAVTDKVKTTGDYFVEIEHHQPADIPGDIEQKIVEEVIKGLDALGIENGASHTEVFLTPENEIKIVEIAGRMGGDLIGSHMVQLSTGFDFLRAVIEIALGIYDVNVNVDLKRNFAGVYFVLPKPGKILNIINHAKEYAEVVDAIAIMKKGDIVPETIDGSGTRAGVIVYHSLKNKVLLNPTEVLEFQTV